MWVCYYFISIDLFSRGSKQPFQSVMKTTGSALNPREAHELLLIIQTVTVRRWDVSGSAGLCCCVDEYDRRLNMEDEKRRDQWSPEVSSGNPTPPCLVVDTEALDIIFHRE